MVYVGSYRMTIRLPQVSLLLLLILHHTSQHPQHDSLPDDRLQQDKGCAKALNQNDTFTVDLRLSNVKVPNRDTTYMCQTFDLPSDRDLHMVAVLPLIDAKEVVHHILLFGCNPREPSIKDMNEAEVCGIMPVASCRSLIGTWTIGSSGDCAHPEMGFRVGPRGYRQVFMQVHFNNPKLLDGLTDASGLRLHLTSSLRPNDAGMLVVGQRSLQIEPLEYTDWVQRTTSTNAAVGTHYVSPSMTFSADCPGRCTQHMFGEKGIYIASAVNHMHSLGISQRIEVYRNNTLVHTVTDQHDYNYNFPVMYTFPQPVHVLPGDELRTTCVYKRPTSPNPVCFGEATSDEMCFGFLTYFPAQELKYPWCTSMGSMKSCDRHLPQLGLRPINGCKWWEFRDISRPDTKLMFGRILMSCYSSEGKLECGENCKSVVGDLLSHSCMQDDVGAYMIDRIKKDKSSGQVLIDALLTCSCRNFRYCDRKLPDSLLGSQQSKWCPSSAPPVSVISVRWLKVLLWCVTALWCHARLL